MTKSNAIITLENCLYVFKLPKAKSSRTKRLFYIKQSRKALSFLLKQENING